jgi:hypothetical protein
MLAIDELTVRWMVSKSEVLRILLREGLALSIGKTGRDLQRSVDDVVARMERIQVLASANIGVAATEVADKMIADAGETESEFNARYNKVLEATLRTMVNDGRKIFRAFEAGKIR